jgi:hypothetical protein
MRLSQTIGIGHLQGVSFPPKTDHDEGHFHLQRSSFVRRVACPDEHLYSPSMQLRVCSSPALQKEIRDHP